MRRGIWITTIHGVDGIASAAATCLEPAGAYSNGESNRSGDGGAGTVCARSVQTVPSMLPRRNDAPDPTRSRGKLNEFSFGGGPGFPHEHTRLSRRRHE